MVTFASSSDTSSRPDTPVVVCYLCERRVPCDGTACSLSWIGWVEGPDGETYCGECKWLADDQIVLEAIDEGCNYLSEILDRVCAKAPRCHSPEDDERLVKASLSRLYEAGFIWSYTISDFRYRDWPAARGDYPFYVCNRAQVRDRWRATRPRTQDGPWGRRDKWWWSPNYEWR